MPKSERLLVREPFGGYAFGDRITSPAAMRKALAEHPEFVVREADGEEEAQEAAAADAAKQPAEGRPPAAAPAITRATLKG